MVVSVCLLTIFLSVIAVRFNWERNKAVLLLAAALIFYSLFIIVNDVAVQGESEFLIALLFANFAYLFFLPGPLVYFYFRAITQDRIRFHWYDVLHFIPFIISLIGSVPYIVSSWDHKLWVARIIINNIQDYRDLQFNFLIPVAWNQYLRPFIYLIYAVWSLILVLRFRNIDNDTLNPVLNTHYRSIKQWATIVLVSIIISTISYTVAVKLFLDTDASLFKNFGPIWLQISAFVYTLVPASLLLYPNVVYGFVRLQDDFESFVGKSTNKKLAHSQDNDENEHDVISGVNNRELVALKKAIMKYIEEETPYIKEDFKLVDIANYLNVPPHHVSYCFTKAFDESFIQLRTRYRVQYAAHLFEQGMADQYSVEGVGKMSGFASKSRFFSSFKEYTGLSPQKYITNVEGIKKPEQS